jgi:hypothetical protein
MPSQAAAPQPTRDGRRAAWTAARSTGAGGRGHAHVPAQQEPSGWACCSMSRSLELMPPWRLDGTYEKATAISASRACRPWTTRARYLGSAARARGNACGSKRRNMRPNRPPLSPKSAWLSVTPFCGQPGTQLRALWAVWPVEVRVLFGRMEKPRIWRGFLRSRPPRHRAEVRVGPTRSRPRRQMCPPASRSAARRSRLRRAGRCAGRARSGAAPAAAGLRRSDARAR